MIGAFLHLPHEPGGLDKSRPFTFSVIPGLKAAIIHYSELNNLNYIDAASLIFGLGNDLAEALVIRLFEE